MEDIYENICKKCDKSITLKEKWDKFNEDETTSPYIKIHTYCGHEILSHHLVTSDDEYPIIECQLFIDKIVKERMERTKQRFENKENKNG